MEGDRMPRRNEPVNRHDPYCPATPVVQGQIKPVMCTYCQLIREVRIDEQIRDYWDSRYRLANEGMPG